MPKGSKKSLKKPYFEPKEFKDILGGIAEGKYEELKEKKERTKMKSNGRLYISEKAMDNYCKSIVEHEKNKASEK